MSMNDWLGTRQLGWIANNRRVPQRTESVAHVAERVMTRTRKASEQREGCLSILRDVLDDEALVRCCVGPVRGGTLYILVDDERLCSVFHMRWADAIHQRLSAVRPQLRARQVRFVPQRDADVGSAAASGRGNGTD